MNEMLSYLDEMPQKLRRIVWGNHFLFVGEKGAKEVTDCLEEFEITVSEIKQNISGILS